MEITEYRSLQNLTTFRIGGQARYFCQPANEADLITLSQLQVTTGLPLRILGGGSNLLVSDSSVRQNQNSQTSSDYLPSIVVKLLRDSEYGQIRLSATDQIVVGSSCSLSKLVNFALVHKLAGLEDLAGIPGTVGGAIVGNCGGGYGGIGRLVRSVRLWDFTSASVIRLSAAELEFSYRSSNLSQKSDNFAADASQYAKPSNISLPRLLLDIELQLQALTAKEQEQLPQKHAEFLAKKQQTQPLSCFSAGCIFKNPPGQSAGQLIDQANLKTTQIGNAAVSSVHANFIINKGGATAHDVMQLIKLIQQRVAEQFAVNLELEIKIWQ